MGGARGGEGRKPVVLYKGCRRPASRIHGTKDHVVPFSQSDSLANELEKYGREYEFHALRNADHGSWQFWTPEMLDLVEAFIKEHLK